MSSEHVSVDLETNSVSKGESSDIYSSRSDTLKLEKLQVNHEREKESNHTAESKSEHSQSPLHWLHSIIRGKTLSWKPLALSILWSSVVVVLSKLTSRNYPQEKCRWFCTTLAIDPTIHGYVGTALFLLLAFRVNESYQRYLEGLRLWSSIAGTTCSLSKYILQAFSQGFFHKGDRERMLSWLVAFPIALKRELREERSLPELRSVLSPEDQAGLANAGSMSSHTLYVISAYIIKAFDMKDGPSSSLLFELISGISSLRESAAQCNQIRRMPCAFSYVAHLQVFLLIWLVLLPFTIVEKIGWGTPIIAAFVSYGLIGVELNAQELENPFGRDYNDLPLGMFTEQILECVRENYKANLPGANTFVHESDPVELIEGETFWLEKIEQ